MQQLNAIVGSQSFRQQSNVEVSAPGELPATFTHAGLYFNHIVEQGVRIMAEEEDKPFFIDGHRLPIYQQLAAYFSNDYSYFRCGLDQQKGLLIFGGFGVGKSLMMRLFRVNTLQSFRIVGSRAIRDQYRTTGNYSDYTRAFQNKISAQYFGQANIGLCIDDAGAETVVSHYNNTANVIAEIIQDRYERPALRGPMTHIITNATTNELREAYGPRVYSRLRQLFNIIAFDETATDLRE